MELNKKILESKILIIDEALRSHRNSIEFLTSMIDQFEKTSLPVSKKVE